MSAAGLKEWDPAAIDADEERELKTILGGDADPKSPAETDALASDLLRRMAECRAEINRYKASMAAEVSRISSRYADRIEPLEDRFTLLERAVLALADIADFGKAKSRNVGFGSYGRRAIPERLKIIDPPKLLDWAKATPGCLVMIEWNARVPHEDVVKYFKDHPGALPDGVEYTASREEAFARPVQEEPS